MLDLGFMADDGQTADDADTRGWVETLPDLRSSASSAVLFEFLYNNVMRPRFTLKTLMLAVTLMALGLGFFLWQQRLVDERKALLVEIESQGLYGGYLFVTEAARDSITYKWIGCVYTRDLHEDNLRQPSLSGPWWFRQWLGDTAIRIIWISPHSTDTALVERIPILFPEALIRRYPVSFEEVRHPLNPLEGRGGGGVLTLR
jgi:hypothetical protein